MSGHYWNPTPLEIDSISLDPGFLFQMHWVLLSPKKYLSLPAVVFELLPLGKDPLVVDVEGHLL